MGSRSPNEEPQQGAGGACLHLGQGQGCAYCFSSGSTLVMIKLMEGAEQFPAAEVICFLSGDLALVSSFHHLEEQ